jgi:bacteriocin-like protein
VAELTDAELNHVTGGAFQAHISIHPTKQGQLKG